MSLWIEPIKLPRAGLHGPPGVSSTRFDSQYQYPFPLKILLFDFDTQDSISNDSTGLYIDDIHITSTCLPKPCSDDFQCADGLTGTIESCGLAGCEYTIP